MRALCRAFDWSATPLGPIAQWPRSLRAVIATALASRHPMFLWWGSELIQLYNDAYRPSFGLTSRHPAALGMRGDECWTEIWDVIGPQIQQVMSGEGATWHEDHLVPILRDGGLVDVYWTYSFNPAFDDAGAIGGVLVVCQETTRRVQETAEREHLIESEKNARLVAESAREAMGRVFAQAPVAVAVLHGPEFLYTAANERYRMLIGNRDPVGATLLGMFPDLAGSPIEGVLRTVHDSGRPFVANDFQIPFDSAGAGPSDNYYDLLYHPLAADEDGVVDIVVIAIDVTDRRGVILERQRLLDEADAARAEAVDANLAKSAFLAVMSHELRTPLNAIGGYADLLLVGVHGTISPAQRTAVERIYAGHQHLLGLVNAVLDFARLERGTLSFTMSNVALDEILTTCLDLMVHEAGKHAVELRYASCAAGSIAHADPDKVRQIVLNLLSNGIKFTPSGGVVEVSCSLVEGRTLITVRDSGMGIAADQLGRVFEPFVQVDSQLTRVRDGVGLGLAISRELARGMGGDLTLQSTPGVGSVFRLSLPTPVQ